MATTRTTTHAPAHARAHAVHDAPHHEHGTMDIVEHERTVAADIAREEGKPEKIIDRIVEGRLGGFFKENCLLDQPAISDDKKTVAQTLEAAGVTLKRFVRFSAGE